DRPGVDDFLDSAGERRVHRLTADHHNHAGNELAHRGELQAHIALVGEACFAGDAYIDLLAPAADFFGREPAIERLTDNVANERADLRPGAFDDRFDAADLRVEIGHPGELVGDRLGGGQVRKRPLYR